MLRPLTLAGFIALALAACDEGGVARDEIRIVGSSTVYPFTTTVAEAFRNKRPDRKAPVIEATGTGAGIKQFCAGIGPLHPDILNASRRLKKSEYDACAANGVSEIIEVQVGLDGVAFAESNRGPRLRLGRTDIYRALAAFPGGRPNTARLWSDVNPGLPRVPIQMLGPPATSGTRDALAELILAPACEALLPQAAEWKEVDPDRFARTCTRVRDDAAYVDSGENDNLIVQKLDANPSAVGIFGFSYLEENADRLHGVPVDGVEPTYETISTGRYPGARPLYIYVKKRHLRPVPGLADFLADYAAAWGPDGPLVRKGMIAAPRAVRAASAAIVARGTTLDPAALQ
ncbi:phosphate ABC transporter substrate-binding protein [Sphingomonas spermidinifaciens]|uniref:Phosphate ABC transporter substrate-binding protein n=1 Tax=Sphingomonas spermidinifaciens TaxID=1141889 RepID=A0A2A4B539_9SPHN|nr:substrate-binding domain-containing protein [Sphingomonas spermidinifaciens]PCD03065.1 phosphate ABC transporter substrate-binding protein [Sphingomonas spermidinifaciens]